MSEVVAMVAMSHSPSWNLQPLADRPGAGFYAGVMRARQWVEAAQPDTALVFGPDHYRNFFYDVLPQFCIGTEQIVAFGDYDSPSGNLPCAADLGRHILVATMSARFDPAASLKMGVDHGITQPYAAVCPDLATPLVPVMINANGGPRPSLARCVDFGRAVGDAIRSFPGHRRVLVIASGGLSHWLPKMSADDPQTPADTRDYLINGRANARDYNAAKERSSRERRQRGGTGPINETWDRWFLDHITRRDFGPVLEIDDMELERLAGNGAHELRSWLAAAAAWGGPLEIMGYEPVPTWVTGMGIIAGGIAHA